MKWIKSWLKPPRVGTYLVICEMTKDTAFHKKGDKVIVIDESDYTGWSLENEDNSAWKVLEWAEITSIRRQKNGKLLSPYNSVTFGGTMGD